MADLDPEFKALLERLAAPSKPASRCADWDAAIERRKPIRFKFLDVWWEVGPIDFRALAAMFRMETYAGLSDEEATAKQVAFIGAHVREPLLWEDKTAKATIAPSTMMGGLKWLLEKDAGMPLEIEDGDDPDPLDAPSASSKSAGGNGRSSPGGSPAKRASKTR